MFSRGDNEVISIDNMVCCIHPENDRVFTQILERVRYAAHAVSRAPHCVHSDFARVTALLNEGCVEGQGWPGLGINVGDEGALEVQTGFLNTMEAAAHGSDRERDPKSGITLQVLQKMKDWLLSSMADRLPNQPREPNKPFNLFGLEYIHPQFCAAVVDTFRDALELHEMPGRDRLSGSAQSVESNPPAHLRLSQSAAEPGIDEMRRKRHSRFYSDLVIEEGDAMPMAPSEELQKRLAQDLQKHLTHHSAIRESAIEKCNQKLMQKARQAKERVAEKHQQDSVTPPSVETFYGVEQLACLPPWPEEVDPTRREHWLSPEEFRRVLGMEPPDFYALPMWKQRILKRNAKLF